MSHQLIAWLPYFFLFHRIEAITSLMAFFVAEFHKLSIV
ncbi:putative membrane protein [Vibrio anguillarum]|nr:putative membrane protein [Vibrio anguillarum]